MDSRYWPCRNRYINSCWKQTLVRIRTFMTWSWPREIWVINLGVEKSAWKYNHQSNEMTWGVFGLVKTVFYTRWGSFKSCNWSFCLAIRERFHLLSRLISKLVLCSANRNFKYWSWLFGAKRTLKVIGEESSQ